MGPKQGLHTLPTVQVVTPMNLAMGCQNDLIPSASGGNLPDMNQISFADILELPLQERIQLVEVIWESIAVFPQAIEVSPELKIELEARLAEFERSPEAGYSWDEVKAHLKSGSWPTA